MVNKLFLVLMILFGLNSFAQDFTVPKNFITTKQGFAISPNAHKNLYLNLELAYYTDKKWSLISGANFFLANNTTNRARYFNNEVFLGVNRHFFIQNINFYVGAQPGFSFTNYKELNKNYTSPLVTFSGGINYFSSKYFHLFTQVRYVYTHHTEQNIPANGELRIAFGLGYNLTQIYTAIFNKK